jgi:hypothetical protein
MPEKFIRNLCPYVSKSQQLSTMSRINWLKDGVNHAVLHDLRTNCALRF